MVDIVDRSRFATAGAICDIYHIARSALQQIGEEHRVAGYAQEASTVRFSILAQLVGVV